MATVLHFQFPLSLLMDYQPAKYSPFNVAALTFRGLILNAKNAGFYYFIFLLLLIPSAE